MTFDLMTCLQVTTTATLFLGPIIFWIVQNRKPRASADKSKLQIHS
jgi:hypothetical protein